IQQAVYGHLGRSRAVYEWVCNLCRRLGAQDEDLVPFEKYAAAGTGLLKPSSAARALAAGATDIERIDLLVKLVAGQLHMRSDSVNATVERVDGWLAHNRTASAGAHGVAGAGLAVSVEAA